MHTYFEICETRVQHLQCPTCGKGSMQFSFDVQKERGFSSPGTMHVCTNCGHTDALDEQWPKIGAIKQDRFQAVILKEPSCGLPAGTYPRAEAVLDGPTTITVEYVDVETTELVARRLDIAQTPDDVRNLRPENFETVNVTKADMLWPLVCVGDLRVSQYCKQYGSHYIILEAVPCLTAPQLST